MKTEIVRGRVKVWNFCMSQKLSCYHLKIVDYNYKMFYADLIVTKQKIIADMQMIEKGI